MYIVHVAYCVRDKSSSLYACRLDCLEQVHQSLCLQPLQLGVQADERPSATHSVTAGLKKLNFSKYFRDFNEHFSFLLFYIGSRLHTHTLYIPAHDNDVLARAAPLGLAEEVHQRQYGCGVGQAQGRPAGELQQSDQPVRGRHPPPTLHHLQPALRDVAIAAQPLQRDPQLPVHVPVPRLLGPEAVAALLHSVCGHCAILSSLCCETYTNTHTLASQLTSLHTQCYNTQCVYIIQYCISSPYNMEHNKAIESQ